MKVVLISNLYEPYARGGAEIIVKRTALEMKKQGHDVSVITARPWNGWNSLNPEIEEIDGIRFIRFFPLNLYFYAYDYRRSFPVRLVWHFFDLFNFQSSNLIRDLLALEKPDLVITHNLMGLGYFIPGVIGRLGIKHIHVLHDIQLAVRSGLMKKGQEQAWFVSGVPARIYQRIVKSLFGSPDVVISPSKFLLNFYDEQGYFPESKKRVLQNPIAKRFLAVQLRHPASPDGEAPLHDVEGKRGGEMNVSPLYRGGADASERSDEADGVATFAYIGQLAEHKGLRTLKKAFTMLQDEKIQLSLVGNGPLKDQMQDWADHDLRVQYHGRIANEDLPEFLASIDCVILPTETYENSPTIIFESLATGTPVIVSDIGGAAEPIQEGKNGYTFEPGHSDQLAEKIKTMMQSHDSMREAAKASVKGMGEEEYVSKLLQL